MSFRLLPAAVRDLEQLRAYLAKEDPGAAECVARRLEKAMMLLSQKPEIGRPSSQRPVREWTVPGLPFIIPYRIDKNTVEILRVFHTRRTRPGKW